MKLVMYRDCRLVKIETEAFRLTLGELQNNEIKAVLKPLGIDVQFIEDPSKTRYDQAEIKRIADALGAEPPEESGPDDKLLNVFDESSDGRMFGPGGLDEETKDD